ncbi:MAG: MoaD/ThiS family protein [Pirellulaceae bacterium]
MKIRVKLMGILKERSPAGGMIELPDQGTIEDALLAVGIPADSVQVFTVNGDVERDRRRVLKAEDELTVLPPMAGG